MNPLEPPKVLLNDGTEYFQKIGNSWVVTGQVLGGYITDWNAATTARLEAAMFVSDEGSLLTESNSLLSVKRLFADEYSAIAIIFG